MKHLHKLAAAAVAGLAFAAVGSANATTIIINGTTNAQITCESTSNPTLDPACHAFSEGAPDGMGQGVGDPTAIGTLGLTADLYDGQPAGDQFEVDQIEILSGMSFTVDDHQKGPESPGDFTSSALYILLKLSNTAVWIKNLSGGALMISYTDSTCKGGVKQDCFKAGGLSHYSEVGEIPIPGAIWLMGAGLAGLGFASRRKKNV